MESIEKIKVSDEERKVLHNLLDKICDEGKPFAIWEAYFRGDEPFTFVKKRMSLHMTINEEIERR